MNKGLGILILLGTLAMPAFAQSQENECSRRFNICAEICAVLRGNANDGCLGSCLESNGCEINDSGPRSDRLAAGTLPRSTLPKGALPDSTLPDSLLK